MAWVCQLLTNYYAGRKIQFLHCVWEEKLSFQKISSEFGLKLRVQKVFKRENNSERNLFIMVVRYLTISRLALELVSAMSDSENALFNRLIFTCFTQLENGQKPDIPATENAVLNIAIREAVQELDSGYRTYCQRVNARKKDQRSITDKSPIDQRSTIDRKDRRDENREIYGTINSAGIDDSQRTDIEHRLNDLGIEKADSGFWNTCFLHGYEAVDGALSKAESVGNGNIKFITGLIANGVEY